MNTTRIAHTNCTHDSTPRGRAWCRGVRKDAIRRAQAAYTALWAVQAPAGEAYDEYHALVSDVAFQLEITTDAAYEIVENGPVVTA